MIIGTLLLAALAVANGGSADRAGKVVFESRFDSGFGEWTTTNNVSAPVDYIFTNLEGRACLRVSKHSQKDRGTRWGFTSKSFAVDGGTPAYLELDVRGTYRLHLSETWTRGAGCRFYWYDAKGNEIADEKFAVQLPGDEWKTAHLNLQIPAEAVRGTVTLGAQHPPFKKPGEYFAIAGVKLVTGASWRGGDGEGPYLETITPSPNVDVHATIRFRLTDESGVDYAKTRIFWKGAAAEGLFTLKDGVYELAAPAEGWKWQGVYRLKVMAVDTLGNRRTEETLFYFDRPAAGPKFALRDDGMFLHDGKPFFPLGLSRVVPMKANGYSLEAAVRQCQEAGFNNLSRFSVWDSKQTADEWFDLLAKYGLFSVVDTESTRDRSDDESRIRNVIYARDRKNAFIWDVADDTSNFRTGDEVRSSHHFVKAIDDNALTAHADGVWPWHAETYSPYVRSADVFAFELYPFHSDSPWNRSRSLAVLVDNIERVKRYHREAGAPYVGFIGIIQDFIGWSDWKMMPTFAEVRAMTYLAVIHGCRGLRWYAYSGEPVKPGGKKSDPNTRAAADDPQTWAELSSLVHELRDYETQLTARDASVQPQVTIVNGPDKDAFGYASVTCLAKAVPGGFLMAVNHTTNEVTAVIRGGGIEVEHTFKGDEVLICDERGKLPSALNASSWKNSQWLSVKNAPVRSGVVGNGVKAAPGTSWFVAEYENPKEIVSAKWMTTGLGVYEVYVNGRPVGSDFLKPGFTHNAKTKYSFTYDITALVKTAKGVRNVFAAEVSAGWWRDKVCSPSRSDGGFLRKKSAFRGVIEFTYRDGTRRLWGTNVKDWCAGIAGPVMQAGIFDGETCNAQQRPGYARIEALNAPEINYEFQGEILPTHGAEVTLRHDLTLNPIAAYVWRDVVGDDGTNAFGTVVKLREYAKGEKMVVKPGEQLVLDFGQNCAAIPHFRFRAPAGTMLTALPAEMLNDGNGLVSRGNDGPEGSVYRVNLRAGYEDGRLVNYTFAGDGWENYHPRFTFFGYRYISVSATETVEIESMTSIPVTSITKAMEAGAITTGAPDINRLISNVYWGQLSNYLSVPTDCPQRNERLGWTADTQVFSEAASFNAKVYDFLYKWMRDLRDSQLANGSYPAVAPLGQYGEDGDRLGWADAGVIVPYVMWKQYGDLRIVRENWSSMKRYLARLDETHGATLPGAGQYADWLSYERYEPCGAPWRKAPPKEALEYWDYLGACYWLWDARMMSELAEAQGLAAEALHFRQTAAAAEKYLRQRFVGADGMLSPTFRDLQTACLFALKLGLVQGEAKQKTMATLRQNIADHDGCLQTGFLGTSILMDTLTENGMVEVAYSLLFQHKNPSWLYSVDQGATTIWERWNSYTKDKGFGPVSMNSFNHYAYGAVLAWLYKTAAGIAADPKSPGFKNIVMAPKPDRRLGFVKAEYKSAAGVIKSHWRYEGDIWVWEFTIPSGATADVTLPGETQSRRFGAGNHKLRVCMQ